MKQYNRLINPAFINDPQMAYNEPAGAKKTITVGPVLLPLSNQNTFTTNCTAPIALPQIGRSIAVYNNSTAVGSITLGKDSTVTSLSPGAINANGQAGIPCPPNAWTYISLGFQQFVIASAATLLVYLIDDGTYLVPESK